MILIPLTAFLLSGYLSVVSAETSPNVTNNQTEYVIPDGGFKLEIYCETQGDPKPSIRWEINATGNLNFNVSKNASLVITNPRMSERYGLVNVTCIANNTVGTARKTFRIVFMKAATITTDTKVYDVPDDGTSEIEFNCKATGFPSPVISWSIKESILPEGLSVTYRDNGTKSLNVTVFNDGRLRITTSQRNEGFGMNVTCIANNTAGSDERKTYPVRFLKAPMILTKSSNITIVGDTASLLYINCETTGYPKPVVEWIFGEHRLNSSHPPIYGVYVIHINNNGESVLTRSSFQVLSDGRIHIENPFTEDHVPYRRFSCVANNAAGQDIRTHFLNFDPSVSYQFRAWFSKGVDNLEANIRIKINNTHKQLKLFDFNITAINLTDATADFTLVWAENDLQHYGKPRNVTALANDVNTTLKGGNGTVEKLIMFTSPPAPTGLVVDGKTTSEISFSWKHPVFFDISYYNIQKDGTNQNKIVPGHKTSATLYNLDGDTRYLIGVEPVIKGSKAGGLTVIEVKTKAGIPVGAIIVVVIVLVLVAILVVLVVVYYRRRKLKPLETNETNPYEESIPGVPIGNIYTRGNLTICPMGTSVESSDKAFFSWNEIPRESVTIGDVLGEGEFGLVQKASWLDEKTNKEVQVAVKTVKDYASETDRKELFKELRLMAGIEKHPNVVNLVGACSRGGPLWILVEFCRNGNLLRYLKDNRKTTSSDGPSFTTALEPLSRIRLAYDVSKGMHYLQEKKIIHRDLAARNVLLGDKKIAKVSDFGLSRDIYEVGIYQKKTGGKLPVKWMAIESLQDYSYNSKSDIWSFGVLLWEIETAGLVPYPAFGFKDLLTHLERGGRLDKPEETPPEIYEIMLTCWESYPEERPDFKQLESKLEGILMNMSDYLETVPEDETNSPDMNAAYVNYYPSESDEETPEQDSAL